MDLERVGNTYVVSDDDVELRFSGVASTGDTITSFLRVYLKIPTRKNISTSKLNLLAPRSISDLARRLNEVWEADWSGILQAACTKVIEDILAPPIPEQIQITQNVFPKFLVDKFIIEQSPTLWFAPGGSGKSLLALALGICTENGYDFFGECEPNHTLYLDWETDKTETDRRASLLVGGIANTYETKKEEIKLPTYMRMYLPLIDSVDSLVETAYMHNIKFIIIDSVAPALADDLPTPAAVTKFFSGIRKLNASGVTTLLITHVSKEAKKSNSGSPFGSVFFENFPRLTWELKSDYDESKGMFTFGIFCRKSNVGRLESKGIALTFLPGEIKMDYVEPEDTGDTKHTLKEMITSLLKDKSMTPREIASTLQASPQTIWVVLSQLKKQGLVTNSGGEWRAVQDEAAF